MGQIEYFTVNSRDKSILRRIGARIGEIAADRIMKDRRRQWKKLNALEGDRPMVLVETQGVIDEVVPPGILECAGDWARDVERGLRNKIFYYENIGDDTVIEPRITYNNRISSTNYGVESVIRQGDNGQGHGSIAWEPALKKLPEDLTKLQFRRHEFDRGTTLRDKELLEEVFEGVLPVVNRNWYWWTQGLTGVAINLIGLEGFMLAMYDQPENLHKLMAFLRDDYMQTLDWFEQQGLLMPNNEDDYIGSGSLGYTDQLPQKDYIPGKPGRLKDMWGLSESQETVSVSPGMFAEFVFPYQLPVISRFGFACYGCCEPLHNRWHIIRQIPNLRRVSVSPWADKKKMAEYLGKDYVYSYKPNPAYISAKWNEDLIRKDLKDTLRLTKGLNVELVMKDVHTLCNEPWRLGRWTQIARETIGEIYPVTIKGR